MKVTLEPVTHYRVVANGTYIDTMAASGRWEGMLKLSSGYEKIIIVDDGCPLGIGAAIDKLFGDGEKPREVEVFKASPDIAARILKAHESKQEE